MHLPPPPPPDYWYTSFFLVGLGPLHEIAVSPGEGECYWVAVSHIYSSPGILLATGGDGVLLSAKVHDVFLGVRRRRLGCRVAKGGKSNLRGGSRVSRVRDRLPYTTLSLNINIFFTLILNPNGSYIGMDWVSNLIFSRNGESECNRRASRLRKNLDEIIFIQSRHFRWRCSVI